MSTVARAILSPYFGRVLFGVVASVFQGGTSKRLCPSLYFPPRLGYCELHGKMYSTCERASLSERCSGLPRMWWPWWLSRLRQLRIVFTLLLVIFLYSILLIGRRQWRGAKQRPVHQKHKASLVGSRFVSVVHA